MTTKGSNNPFPSVLLNEVATDGSDTPTPAADYRRLFLGEDGLLYLIDSADAVTPVANATGAVATDAIWDAAGDIVQGTGANTAARLALGAAGTAVVSNGTNNAYGFPNPSFTGWLLTATGVTMTSGAAWKASFGSEVRDTHAYHDNSTNPTRCTIPSGKGGLYRVTFNVRFPGAFTGAAWVGIAKNGSFTGMHGQFQISDAGANTDRQCSMVSVLDLVATDYIEAGGLFCATTRTDLIVEFAGEWLGA